MVEDPVFNEMIKAALESKGPLEIRQVRPSIFRWAVPTLLAASLTVMAVFQVTFPVRTDALTETICLLSEVEGIDLADYETETAAELLLAWQDAPCVEWL